MPDDQLPSTKDILTTSLLSPPDSAHCVAKLNDKLVAKHGPQVTFVEAETMQHVSNHSDVPVPKVHKTLMDPVTQQNIIVMDFVPGQTLKCLLPFLTPEEKDEIARLIKNAIAHLRDIPEPGYLGSVGRKAYSNGMFWNGDSPDPLMSGPFDSEAAFNEGLLRKLATISHGATPRNIMIQRTGSREDGSGSFEISLIDWEASGWYPEYWEYCQSIMMGRFKLHWLEMVEKILPVYGYEYALM